MKDEIEHVFSENYENRLKKALTEMFGEKSAEEILYYRKKEKEKEGKING